MGKILTRATVIATFVSMVMYFTVLDRSFEFAVAWWVGTFVGNLIWDLLFVPSFCQRRRR